MWICRLLHKSFSSTKLAAVSIDKVLVSHVLISDLYYKYFLQTKLQSFVANLIASGQFSCESDVVPYEESAVFDFSSYFQHFSSVTTGILSSSASFGQTLLVADRIPTTMKLLDG